MFAIPEMMTSAATDLAAISSDLKAAHLTAARSTTELVPAAADEVSSGIAHLFSQYGGSFQALAGKVAAFHDQFVANLKTGAAGYASTEAAAVTSLRPLLSLLPSWLNNALTTAGLYVAGFLVGAIVIGYVVLAWLISLPAGLLRALGLLG
jgi:PE family